MAELSLAEVLEEIQELIKQDGKQAKGTMISNIYSYDFADNEHYEKIMKLANEPKLNELAVRTAQAVV